ncbi:12514_t:CDS:2 [Rhizophagus irregularis]|nr:12514_t:CDS:2 [Rhizophagus irregularis]
MEVETLRGRNRKAAARYRAKNKEKMTKITINLHSLKETHNCLKQEVSNLQNEVIRLKEAFLSESDLCTPGTCQHYQDFINLYLPRIYDTATTIHGVQGKLHELTGVVGAENQKKHDVLHSLTLLFTSVIDLQRTCKDVLEGTDRSKGLVQILNSLVQKNAERASLL